MIGLTETDVFVDEDVIGVTVCARVMSGTIGNRTFTVTYSTGDSNDTAMGMSND